MARRSSHHSLKRSDPIRLSLAQEAARIMVDQGVEDFLLAKRKAAERLRLTDQSALPSNAEIAAALAEHQRLFQADSHPVALQELRRSAVEVMRMLKDFEPRLVGSVLSGTATPHAEINVQVFIDHPEAVALHLLERGIQPKHAEKKLRYEADRQVSYPSFKFLAGEQQIEIVVLPGTALRQAPLSPVDGKPMERASLEAVLQLL